MPARVKLPLLSVLTVYVAACAGEGAPQRPPPGLTADAAASAAQPDAAGWLPPADGGASDAALLDIQRSTRSSLQWKRYAAFESDLSQALELPKEELCNEFGKEPCISKIHLSPLGGHDPITTGLLEPPPDPQVTTSTVVERVVLSACLARIEKDLALGKDARVFGALDLTGPAPAPDAPATQQLVASLYRRFLARDPSDDETQIVAALTRDEANQPVPASTFAATACLVVGTNTEFLFF